MREVRRRRDTAPRQAPIWLGLWIALLPFAVGLNEPALAQTAADPGIERRRLTQAELDQLARDIRTSEEREAQIRLEIDGLERDRVRISEQLVATSTRIQSLESQLLQTERRIAAADSDAEQVRVSLVKRRAVLADVLAALQRMGRKPPPALLVRPEDALASVRSAILVGALLPELRREAERLIADLERLSTLKARSATEREAFRADLASLTEERSRLELLFDERRRAKGDQQRKLEEERRRAADLAGRATGLKDFIGRLETEVDSSRRAAEAARKADEEAAARAGAAPPASLPDQKSVTAVLRDPSRIQPSIAFADAKGQLNLPVAGTILKGFGEEDGLGGVLRGVRIATRAEARVSSPSDGWVVYAGPFRSYGKLLIINGGGGYHIILAGLERIDVELGQFVLSGEPIGVMAARRLVSSASTAADGQASEQPVLYVEFRKENSSIDPAPWWAQSRDEKVRG